MNNQIEEETQTSTLNLILAMVEAVFKETEETIVPLVVVREMVLQAVLSVVPADQIGLLIISANLKVKFLENLVLHGMLAQI